jgi:hypothetical protein
MGLARTNRNRLAQVNRRLEVPAIDHDGLIVVNSADIVGYLDCHSVPRVEGAKRAMKRPPWRTPGRTEQTFGGMTKQPRQRC